jgi:hypothetical protein
MFREHLEMTLKKAVDVDLYLFEIIEDGPFDRLIIAMQPDIRACLAKVRLIAIYKRMHNYLHELRPRIKYVRCGKKYCRCGYKMGRWA